MARGERARYWQYAELPGVDLLHAHYIQKTFSRHTHETFVYAAITEGVESFHSGNELVHAGPGQIALVNPDTPHTGYAGVPEGWTYRTIYPDAELIRSIAADALDVRAPVGFTRPVVDDPYAAQLVIGVHRAAEEGNALAADSLLRLVTVGPRSVLQCLGQNFSGLFSISPIASAALEWGVSRSRWWKPYAGVSCTTRRSTRRSRRVGRV